MRCRRSNSKATGGEQQQGAGTHEQQQKRMDIAETQTTTPRTAGENGTRDTQGTGKRTTRERERATRERDTLEHESMRGNIGPHERKRSRASSDGSAEAGIGKDESDATREAQCTRAQRAHGEEGAMEVEVMATPESMRGTSKVSPEMHTHEDMRGIEHVASEEEEMAGSSAAPRRETTRHDDVDVGEAPAAATAHGGDTAPQPTSLAAGVNVIRSRPKRKSRGQPTYDETNRRQAARTNVAQRNKARMRYVHDGGGRGRVTLAQTVVVGQVCIQRMERAGRDRQDAGRPPREPG